MAANVIQVLAPYTVYFSLIITPFTNGNSYSKNST